MSILKGNAIFGQSGGPTAVINASAAGVFTEALAHTDRIPHMYGALHGILGILNEDFIDIGREDPAEIHRLRSTPSSILGSCRYKLAELEEDETDYRRILEVFQKYDIRYFFYNGGNDSMDTCNKIARYFDREGYACRVVGVPKTIDNDLADTDHCPGYGSAARFVATTTMEVFLDSRVYNRGMVVVIEVMGRHAGWLAASAALAAEKGFGPDLIYLPEVPFDLSRLLADIEHRYTRDHNVMVVVSEGIQTTDGRFLPETVTDVAVDAFGHKQLGGTATVLADFIGGQLGCKVRGIELSLLQRSASHLASAVDVEEAFQAGQEAVRAALAGESDIMIGFARPVQGPYRTILTHVPLERVANHEKMLPRDWINEAGNFVLPPFLDYVRPLVQGEFYQEKEDGLPRFARFRRIQAGDRDR